MHGLSNEHCGHVPLPQGARCAAKRAALPGRHRWFWFVVAVFFVLSLLYQYLNPTTDLQRLLDSTGERSGIVRIELKRHAVARGGIVTVSALKPNESLTRTSVRLTEKAEVERFLLACRQIPARRYLLLTASPRALPDIPGVEIRFVRSDGTATVITGTPHEFALAGGGPFAGLELDRAAFEALLDSYFDAGRAAR